MNMWTPWYAKTNDWFIVIDELHKQLASENNVETTAYGPWGA